ncbi:extracelular cellulose binding protein [Moniliophthora roreri]|nr:extracelular cellulose binding protein [Moniliophthora roreri]
MKAWWYEADFSFFCNTETQPFKAKYKYRNSYISVYNGENSSNFKECIESSLQTVLAAIARDTSCRSTPAYACKTRSANSKVQLRRSYKPPHWPHAV